PVLRGDAHWGGFGLLCVRLGRYGEAEADLGGPPLQRLQVRDRHQRGERPAVPGEQDPLAAVADTADEVREFGPGLRHRDLSCHVTILAFCTFLLFCTELKGGVDGLSN